MRNARTLAVGATLLIAIAYTAGAAFSVGGVGTGPSVDAVENAASGANLEATPDADPGGTIAGDVDLADADAILQEETTNDTSGEAVARGDVDGDGQADLLIGAPGEDRGGTDAGAVYLFFGPVTDGTTDLGDADVILTGEAAGDAAGSALTVGDVDGDGGNEVVVGAPGDDAAATDAGAAYVLDVPSQAAGTISLGDSGTKLLGEAAGDAAGSALATPEVDDDRWNDAGALLVGAPGHDDASGAAYLLRDPSAGTTSLGTAGTVFEGDSAGDAAGTAVAFVGDTDGDDRLDAVVGAPGWNDATGAAYLRSDVLATSGTVSLDGAATRYEGEDTGDAAGSAVALAGDYDDDGRDDVVVGAPGNDAAGEDAGAAYVVLGDDDPPASASLAAAGVVLRGEDAGDQAGYAVSSAGSGDISCDDVDDVLVGAPGNDAAGEDAGAAYVVFGDDDPADDRSLDDASATLYGEDDGDHAGAAVLDGSDLTGDGDKDVVVGAPGHDNHSNVGATYVVEGECPVDRETPTPTDTPTETTTVHTTTTTTTTTTTATANRQTPTDTATPTQTQTQTPTDTATPTQTQTQTQRQTPTDTATPTQTQTRDERAAISYVLLCTTDEDAPTVGGAGSEECAEGEPFVRWEWNEDQNQFVAEDGTYGTTMTATAYKEQGEPVEATWTSDTYSVSGAVVGAGGATCQYPGDSGPLPHSGDVEACSGTAGGGQSIDLGDVGPGIGGALLVVGGLVAAGPSIAARVLDR